MITKQGIDMVKSASAGVLLKSVQQMAQNPTIRRNALRTAAGASAGGVLGGYMYNLQKKEQEAIQATRANRRAVRKGQVPGVQPLSQTAGY